MTLSANAASSAIDELVQMVCRWQPDFADKLVGAPPELIARLEARLIERSPVRTLAQDFVVLAPEHRAFLERMGENYDGINAYGDDVLDWRASALLEYCADEEDYFIDVRQFVLCGAPSNFLVWPLMFDHRSASDELELVRFGGLDEENNDQPIVMPEHSSFIAMLFAFAFMRKCMAGFGWEWGLRSPGTKRPQFPNCSPGRWLPHFATIIRQLGFVPIPRTGPWTVCGERPDAAVMMYESPGFAPDVRVAASDRGTLNQLAEILCDNLELTIHPGTLREPG
jgi:hypothetical protein